MVAHSSPAPGQPHDLRHQTASSSTTALDLDLEEVAGIEGLEVEVAHVRAAVRRLARNGDATQHVKTLAEIRHQIEALCTALKTERALKAPDGQELSTRVAEVLEELGDDLGVPR